MRDPIKKGGVMFVLSRLGYEVIEESVVMVTFRDAGGVATGAPYLAVPFAGDQIDWSELMALLEYEGINPALFLAELES